MKEAEILERIKAIEPRFDNIHNRMDSDYALWVLQETKYEKHKTAINVTSNTPRTFANDVYNDLASADMQIIVRMAEELGVDRREAMAKLERLFIYCLQQADIRLANVLLPWLKDFVSWCSIVRGTVAARALLYKEDKDIIYDIMPYDPRWLYYSVGRNGLDFTAYKMFKGSNELKDEFGVEPQGIPWYNFWSNEKEVYPIWDVWYREVDGKGRPSFHNAVVEARGVLKQSKEETEVEEFPVIIAPVSTSPPLMVNDGVQMTGQGDSIFAPNRKMFDLRNKIASMWATHMKALEKQPLINYRDDKGIELKDTLSYAAGVMNLDRNHNRIEASPMKEISPTMLSFMQWVDSQIGDAILPSLQLGSSPPSGTALNLIREAGNRIYNPQVRCLSNFYASICRLLEGQIRSQKLKIDVKTAVGRSFYQSEVKPTDLSEPHTIAVEFTVKTPWTALDTYQVADMARGLGLPESFIYEHILKLPDPKGVSDLSAIEVAEKSPKMAMLQAIKGLLARGRNEEAIQVVKDMFRMEQADAMQSGELGGAPPMEPEPMPIGPEPIPTEEVPSGTTI